jgi:hypothetical protein
MDIGARRLLRVLRELGYTDAALEIEMLDRVASQVEGLARFEDVRRIAAEIFFERQIDVDGVTFLEEEWKVIFS